MFRLSFDWENLENIKEQPFVFIPAYTGSGLQAQTCTCTHSLYSCMHKLVLVCVYTLFSLCAHKFHSAYMCRLLRTQDYSCACMALGRNPSLGFLAHFSSFFHLLCNLNIILHHFCIQLYVPCHASSYCEFNIIFPQFLPPNHKFNPILFLQVLAPYSSRGSTSRVLVWYNILTKENQGHICAAGFEPVIRLMPERSASVVLVQTLANRWWDTTHTFHIADQEMTITPHDFYRMTVL